MYRWPQCSNVTPMRVIARVSVARRILYERLVALGAIATSMNTVNTTKDERRGAARQRGGVALARHGRDLFRKIFEHSNDAIFIIDPATDSILEANLRASRMLGFSRDELLSQTITAIHPTEMPALRAFAESVFRQGSGWTNELTCRTRDGLTLPAEISASAIDLDGRTCLLAMVRDITMRRRAEGALRQARDELELRVQERTTELLEANIILQRQIAERERAETALRESEARFRTLVEHAPEAIVVLDMNSGKFVQANDNVVRLFGFDRDELFQMGPADLHAPIAMNGRPGPELVRERHQKVLAGATVVFEDLYRAADGRDVPCEVRLVRLPASDRLLIRGSMTDTTHRRRAEAALRESEARFRTLVEHAPDAIVVLDADTGCFIEANERAVQLFELDRESLLRAEPADLMPPIGPNGRPSTEWVREKIQAVLEGATAVFEWIHRSASGRDFPTEVRLVRLPAGDRNLVRGSITDISQRKEAEDLLRRQAQRLRALQEIDRAILLAQSPDAIVKAALGHIRQLIPYRRANVAVYDFERCEGELFAVESLTEVSLGEGMRVPFEAFGDIDALRRGVVNRVDDAMLVAQTPVIQALRAEGLRSWVNVPLLSQSELIGSLNLGWDTSGGCSADDLGVAEDVANSVAIAIHQARLHQQARRHTAELEERVAERTADLESFSYSVSHDLRAPLRAIDGFSRVVLEEYGARLDPEGTRLLEVIRTSTATMGQLIDDLLAFSRARRRDMQPATVDTVEVVHSVFDELLATNTGCRARLHVGALPAVRGDAAMIRQLLMNLLSNALKFTRCREEAVIEVGSRLWDDQIAFYVKDNGVGFDMRHASKLFGVFQRLHRADEFEGTGVGLAIVHRIVQRHSGRVWAESRLGEGATFYFTLPLEVAGTC